MIKDRYRMASDEGVLEEIREEKKINQLTVTKE
jgi:hypothetical protein